MKTPDPNYPEEQVRFDDLDLEPPAPRDQISGAEPAYAKPARPGIGDRVKGWAKETQYRLKEKTAEARRRAEEALRERREYDKARAAFASANRVKMDRSVDTRFWINDEYYIDVDVRYPEAVSAAQKEIQRIRRMVKAQQRPPSGARPPTRTLSRAAPAPAALVRLHRRNRRRGRLRRPSALRAVHPNSSSSPAASDLPQHPAGGRRGAPGAWVTWRISSAAVSARGGSRRSSGNQRRGRRVRGRGGRSQPNNFNLSTPYSLIWVPSLRQVKSFKWY